MKDKDIIKVFKKYRKNPPSGKARRDYFNTFISDMIFRTTKTENPETTRNMVYKVLKKHSS